MTNREERYWRFGREQLQIPEIIERRKGPRAPMDYRPPEGQETRKAKPQKTENAVHDA